MPLITSSLIALSTGFATVLVTSPNTRNSYSLHHLLHDPHALITAQGLAVDIVLAFLVAFLIMCRLEPSWVAQNQSFPYSYHPSWNIGPRSFDFQLLVFRIFHTAPLSRNVHMANILLEEFFWLSIIRGTFGPSGLCIALVALTLQAISYGDAALCLTTYAVNIAYASLTLLLYANPSLNPAILLNLSKTALFWLVTTRTLSHVLEPLPPAYSPETRTFSNGFGDEGWRLCFRDFPAAFWLVLLGNVSEVGAGMPGRLFNPVVYHLLHEGAGYRSGKLLSVPDARDQAESVIQDGWYAHPVTAEMFRWAAPAQEILEKDVAMLVGVSDTLVS